MALCRIIETLLQEQRRQQEISGRIGIPSQAADYLKQRIFEKRIKILNWTEGELTEKTVYILLKLE